MCLEDCFATIINRLFDRYMKLYTILLLTPLPSIAADNNIRDYADSNWWTVYLTGLLCLFTLGLMVYTARLWHATVKLSKDAKENSEEQRVHLIRSLDATERATNAAERIATISGQSLSTAQRAFVFWKGFDCAPHVSDDVLKEYVIFADAENAGMTPAQDVRFTTNIQIQRGSAPQVPFFKTDLTGSSSSVMGPRSQARITYLTISVEDLYDCWKGRAKIFVWMRLEYKDIFSQELRHHHEQCAEIVLIHDPRTIPPMGHPSYLQFGAIGTQNSSS